MEVTWALCYTQPVNLLGYIRSRLWPAPRPDETIGTIEYGSLIKDPLFADIIRRLKRIRASEMDLHFCFFPQFADAPHLYVCVGRHKERNGFSSGFSFSSPAEAFLKAASELIERVQWVTGRTYWHDDTLSGPTASIPDALDISGISGVRKDDREHEARFSFTKETSFHWTRGFDVRTNARRYIPTQLVSAIYAGTMLKDEPILRHSNTNGLATHRTKELALLSGILELIERDAFMIMFHNTITPQRIDPKTISDRETLRVLALLKQYFFSIDMIIMPTDIDIPVIGCIVRDPTGGGPAFAFGAKAHQDIGQAILGAVTEAYAVWFLTRDNAVYKKPLPEGQMTLLERLAYYGKPGNAERLSWMWEGPEVPMPASPKTRTAQELAQHLGDLGCSVAAVTISTAMIQKTGFHSVCVVSPELQPIHLDAFPVYSGGTRLRSVPEKLGLRARKEPPPYFHPFP